MMELEEAADKYLIAHRPQCIDVEVIERHYGSLASYLFDEGEVYDGDHPWGRYIEVSQFHTVSGHTEVIEWEDEVDILLNIDQSGLDDWCNCDGDLSDDQINAFKSRFYERVCELILEDCPDATIDKATPGTVYGWLADTSTSRAIATGGATKFVDRIWERVLEESHNWEMEA
jgi:hypothetical protein